jgi:hypothetical protein
MPSSFVVQAEKDGRVLTLVINSDGKTVNYLQASQDENKKESDGAPGQE